MTNDVEHVYVCVCMHVCVYTHTYLIFFHLHAVFHEVHFQVFWHSSTFKIVLSFIDLWNSMGI